MQPLIVIGDRTSHGGVVIEGSQASDTHGKAIARVGDRVTCPKKGHGGTTVITSGDPTFILDGNPVARHGDMTACGAILLSSQVATFADPGTAAQGTDSSSALAGLVRPATQNASQSPSQPALYDQHFLVSDQVTGKPLAGIPYRLTLETGEAVEGVTNSNGLTETVGATSAVMSKLEVPFYGDSTSGTHTDHGHEACGC